MVRCPHLLARAPLILASVIAWGCASDSEPSGAAGAGAGGTGTGGGGSAPGVAGSAPGAGAGNLWRPAVLPEALDVAPHAAGCGVLALQALTLKRGEHGLELYASLQNSGQAAICSPALSVNLLDESEEPLAMSIGGLLVRRLFRLRRDPQTTAACLAPGDVTMAALTDFPPELTLEQVRRVEYFCNLWSFDAEPTGDLPVSDVKTVPHDGGTTYTGTLLNGLDVRLATPGVTIFPLDGAGRPIGVASARGTLEVAPGDRWSFETDSVPDAGVDFAAFPTPTL